MLYVLLQVMSAPIAVQNKSAPLAYLGFMIFTLSMTLGAYILNNFFKYCCFGSR